MLSETEISRIKLVLSNKTGIDYAILFGSALKRLLPKSDIDLLIGGNVDRSLKDNLLMELTLEIRRPIDIILSKEARYEVVLRALSSGMLIVAHDREKIKEDYFRNYRLSEQGYPLKKIRLERLKRVFNSG